MATEDTADKVNISSSSKTSELLTLDQVASTKDIFISISGLIGELSLLLLLLLLYYYCLCKYKII